MNHINKFKKNFKNKKDFKPDNGRSINVHNDNVNVALRKLKKVLERMDFQKEVSKREYYEKPSVKRKRLKDQAVKKHKKSLDNMIASGQYLPTSSSGMKYLKGKREKRKAWLVIQKIKNLKKRR